MTGTSDPRIKRLRDSLRAHRQRCARLERKAEEALAVAVRALREREKYRNLVEDIEAVIFVIDAEGRITYISPTIAHFTGYEPDGYLGRGFLEAVYEPDRERIRAAYDRVADGEIGSSEYRLYHRNDGCIWIRSFSRPIFENGRFVGLRGVGIDITRLKAAEAAAKLTAEKYQSLLDSIEEGYFEIGLDGVFGIVSPTFCRIVGMETEAVVGRDFREFVPRRTGIQMNGLFSGILQSGGHVNKSDLVFKTRGRSIIAELSASIDTDAEGKPRGFRGLIRDITARRRFERNQKQLEFRLLEAQRLEAVGTLAGGIAHNFNNILMALQGNISLMLLKTDPDDPRTEKLYAAEQCIRDGALLTRQLLEFARSRKSAVRPGSLNDVVRKTARIFSRANRDIRVDTSGLGEIWNVALDENQIQQVLMNLYVNAWQAMQGGGCLSVRTENATLEEPFARQKGLTPGPYVRLSVRDTGEGMDESVQRKVFEPFFTTRGKERGAGLGLAAAYGIVRNHGGVILVNSRKGRGTTFSIYLPASQRAAPPPPKTARHPVRGSGTILVVDDEPFILDITCEGLREMGYDVMAAGNGRKAVDLYRSNPGRIDLVILDLIMPEMDGSATFQRLKALDPEVRVLLTSGYDNNRRVDALRRMGCRGFIQKPFDIAALSVQVDAILRPEADELS